MGDLKEALGSLSALFEKKAADMEEREDQLKRKREEFEEEKRMINTLPRTGPDANVVEINVGGQLFHTKRSTLSVADGSLLAALVSGRWEESLDRDKDGRIFFDFDPRIFSVLLECLRLRHSELRSADLLGTEPRKLRFPEIEPRLRQHFEAMVRSLGLQQLMFEGTVCCEEAALRCRQAGSKDDCITIDGGKIHNDCDAERPVVGCVPLLDLRAHSWTAWKITVLKLPAGGCIYAGIITNPDPADESYEDGTSLAWTLVPEKGEEEEAEDGEACTVQNGDSIIFLLLDDQEGSGWLRMSVAGSARILDRRVPLNMASWERLHLNLYGQGTELVVSAATPGEVVKAGL